MSLRPVPARWFELVTIRKDLARAMECLSRTGAVELEASQEKTDRLALPDLSGRLKAWQEMVRLYRAHWPPPRLEQRHTQDPAETIDAAMARLLAWRGEADRTIDRLETLQAEERGLRVLQHALSHAGALPPLDLLAMPSDRFATHLFAFPEQAVPKELPSALVQRIPAQGTTYLLVVGRSNEMREFEALVPGQKGSVVPLPAWLPAGKADAQIAISERLQEIAAETSKMQKDLDALSERHGVAEATGSIMLLEWLGQHASELRASERLVWVTGWTSDRDGHSLRAALETARLHALVRLSDAPRGSEAPMLLANPRVVRDFEVFARMLGTPAGNEADPSLLLTVIAPLMFGFMFGDVGQGLVLVAAGYVLKKQMPFLRILIPGGLMAMLFGVLFGSVFAREDILPALWLHPLSHPITLLAITIGAGAVVLCIGLLLDALQAHWRGQGREWLATRAGLLLAYAGVLASPLVPYALWLIPAGAAWSVAGHAIEHRSHWPAAAGIAAAEFLEQGIQLVINTISFSRVGAFALAHAGLSAAVIGIADIAGGLGYWIVLLLGNALIIALEGLVVGIQTTRLVLFEFFVRFLKGEGREFKPLSPPDIVPAGTPPMLYRIGEKP